ncbi:unnamed protein product [marine sediment metagenome]|uniref:Ribosome recycling factor domain-containing protein n=1 Tax=marine sediment metagenome TaxID=412755 RepID=X1ASB3_9ZZZZ
MSVVKYGLPVPAQNITTLPFSTVRTGRASVSLLDKVTIDYYGVETSLNQLASLSAPDPRLIVISPYDPTILEDIEKAIRSITYIFSYVIEFVIS